ncbi:hypothetical protein Dimus_018208, partial [Dionaea muscipula]
ARAVGWWSVDIGDEWWHEVRLAWTEASGMVASRWSISSFLVLGVSRQAVGFLLLDGGVKQVVVGCGSRRWKFGLGDGSSGGNSSSVTFLMS